MKNYEGNWGLVVGLGGAFAITAYYDDNAVLALIIAALALVSAIVVYFRVDRPRRARRKAQERRASGSPPSRNARFTKG